MAFRLKFESKRKVVRNQLESYDFTRELIIRKLMQR